MSKLNRKAIRMWWDIKDVAFVGANISRKNGMFMSTANSIPVGSIFEIKKNFIGEMTDENLIFSQETLAEKYENYPKILNDSAKPSTNFTLDSSNETGLEVLASIVESANIADISTELSTIIKNATKIVVKIEQWGVDYVEEGELSVFLTEMANKDDIRIKQIVDGDNYIATRGIWINGMSFVSTIDQEAITKVKAILATKQKDLINAKINLDIKSDLELNIDFKFDKKFYPFFKFRQIKFEKKEDYYLAASADLPDNDVVLDDVNFTEYTV